MGEMADWINENGEWDELLNGRESNPLPHTCKYCGLEGCYWCNIGTENSPKWRLIEPNGQIHTCKEYNNAKTS